MKDALRKRSRRLPPEVADRKARFRAALAMARLTAAKWGTRNKVDPAYLSRFLAGKTVSQPLTDKIEAFIAEHLRAVTEDVA